MSDITTGTSNDESRREAIVTHISDNEMQDRIKKWNDDANMYVASIDATIVGGEKANNGTNGSFIEVTGKSKKELVRVAEEPGININAKPETEKSKALKERVKIQKRNKNMKNKKTKDNTESIVK